jgi:polyisoprenoid-binding protein YceI
MGRVNFWMGTTNRLIPMNETLTRSAFRRTIGLLSLVLMAVSAAAAQDLILQLDPASTTIKFTLGAALHTVHGTLQVNRGSLRLNPASGRLSGEIVVDARSGETGNNTRDRKMHKDVLESERYPEIIFRPDRVDGPASTPGKSSVKVHGIFTIHGSDHEITVPAEVEIGSDHWTAHSRFTIPYVKWGIKNPSTLFLHVSDEVQIDVAAAGTLTGQASGSPSQ